MSSDIDMEKVLIVPGDGFTSYLCADTALDVYKNGQIVLYLAGREIHFTRPYRLRELAILLTHEAVVKELSAKPVAGDPSLRQPQRRRYRDRKRQRQL